MMGRKKREIESLMLMKLMNCIIGSEEIRVRGISEVNLNLFEE